ncbi:MAG: hypothetical protein WBB27_14420 [Maribacter sp.]
MNTQNKDKKKYNPIITKEDLKVIGTKKEYLRRDEGADARLRERHNPVDFAGKDLDIPGRDSAIKTNGLKDEKNEHQSLGSAHNDNLEHQLDTNLDTK